MLDREQRPQTKSPAAAVKTPSCMRAGGDERGKEEGEEEEEEEKGGREGGGGRGGRGKKCRRSVEGLGVGAG